MITTRRDLLKYFGIGTVIAPSVGAQPLARIVEVPKLELIEPPARIARPIDSREIVGFDIVLHRRDGGSETLRGFKVVGGSGAACTEDDVRLSFIRTRHWSPSIDVTVGEIIGKR